MSWQLSALDLADLPMALSTFTQDAWFDHLWQGKVQGHEAIAENLKSLWYGRQHWWIGRQHLMNHFIMEPRVEEGEADVRCFFQIIQHNVEYRNNFVFGIGTRIDHVTRREGRWKFQSLSVNAWTQLADIPWQGEITMSRPPQAPVSNPNTRS
jgi:hypothetical protein